MWCNCFFAIFGGFLSRRTICSSRTLFPHGSSSRRYSRKLALSGSGWAILSESSLNTSPISTHFQHRQRAFFIDQMPTAVVAGRRALADEPDDLLGCKRRINGKQLRRKIHHPRLSHRRSGKLHLCAAWKIAFHVVPVRIHHYRIAVAGERRFVTGLIDRAYSDQVG